jgi:hypothetical protein
MSYTINNNDVNLSVVHDNGKLRLNGAVSNPNKYNNMYVIAANPIDRMINYSGSGLPFPCPTIAFENTPNYYTIGKNGVIKCLFEIPNSYYNMETQEKIVPTIFVALKKNDDDIKFYQVKLNDTLPLKTSVTYRKGFEEGVDFYAKKDLLDIPKNQEDLLRNIGSYKINRSLA